MIEETGRFVVYAAYAYWPTGWFISRSREKAYNEPSRELDVV